MNVLRAAAAFALTVVAGGCITATMVRFGPCFSAGVKLLDSAVRIFNSPSHASMRRLLQAIPERPGQLVTRSGNAGTNCRAVAAVELRQRSICGISGPARMAA